MHWLFSRYKLPFSVSNNIFMLKSVLSDINMATPALIWLLFPWYIFSMENLTFNLFVVKTFVFKVCLL